MPLINLPDEETAVGIMVDAYNAQSIRDNEFFASLATSRHMSAAYRALLAHCEKHKDHTNTPWQILPRSQMTALQEKAIFGPGIITPEERQLLLDRRFSDMGAPGGECRRGK